MSTLTTQATPTPTQTLKVHHDAWQGPSAKARAARAANEYDVPTLVSLALGRLHSRRAHASAHTARAYASGVQRYVTWCQENGVNLLRPERRDGERYRTHLSETLGPGSANTRLVAARAFVQALDWVGLTVVDPFRHVGRVDDPRPEHEVRPAYKLATVALMLRAARDDLDRLIVHLGAGSGMRSAEMLSLTWASINLAARTARVVGKGRKPATIPLTDEAIAVLERLPHREGPILLSDRPDKNGDARAISASTLRYRVARMASAAGECGSHREKRARDEDGTIHALGVHRLRHTYATTLADRYGAEVAQIGLRHASIATTVRYLKGRDQRVTAFARELRLAS